MPERETDRSDGARRKDRRNIVKDVEPPRLGRWAAEGSRPWLDWPIDMHAVESEALDWSIGPSYQQ